MKALRMILSIARTIILLAVVLSTVVLYATAATLIIVLIGKLF